MKTVPLTANGGTNFANLSLICIVNTGANSGSRLQGRISKALRAAEVNLSDRQPLLVRPNDVAGWCRLGDELVAAGKYQNAVACYENALMVAPENNQLWTRRRGALQGCLGTATLPRLDEALPSSPKNATDWTIRAGGLLLLGRFRQAIEASDRALALEPRNIAAARIGIHCRIHACDWSRREADKQFISAALRQGADIVLPINHRALSDSEEEFSELARRWGAAFPITGDERQGEAPYRHEKIRIAYLSTDFGVHPVGAAIVGLLEEHDKARFEITAVSFGPDDKSEIRRRIIDAADRFIDAQAMSDAAAATMLRDLEIDIAVDLNGYTGAKRTGIFVRRPAPVQVNYLGFPGTMHAPFIDYIIANRIVIPEENQIHYAEKIAYLPYAHLPFDVRRQVSATPARRDEGLPESGFVFAALNNSHKIGPELFDVWMRLLRDVEGSVLWIMSGWKETISNLRREAKARGVAPERLVLAHRLPRVEDYLARYRAADLFLDTLPYNAHTRASDALWAGLPVLTCLGGTFPGRVAASLLHAIGLPELVTNSLVEYEQLARTLASEPARLASLKTKLIEGRQSQPLFDSARYARDLETAYTFMWERNQRGQALETFDVSA